MITLRQTFRGAFFLGKYRPLGEGLGAAPHPPCFASIGQFVTCGGAVSERVLCRREAPEPLQWTASYARLERDTRQHTNAALYPEYGVHGAPHVQEKLNTLPVQKAVA
jgi:hypothetical protein